TGGDRIDREKFGLRVRNRAEFDAPLPIQEEIERLHQRPREVPVGGGAFHFDRAGMIVDNEGQKQLIGKSVNRFGAAPKKGAVIGVHTLEIVEELWRGKAAGNAEARTIGN